ncbi:MAG: glycosyltransferase family 4 protein [Ruminococcaceae bacterium]|nr:glycosyltransferase family 4 protein [Oscillospiraceae bacterium]
MAKLLIISYLFAPDRGIGAIRWSKLAKYLTRAGHDIDVITSVQPYAEDSLLKRDIGEMGRIIHISHWYKGNNANKAAASSNVSNGSTVSKSRGGIKSRIKKAIISTRTFKAVCSRLLYYEELRKAHSFAENAERYVLENGGFSQYDAIITTYSPIGDVLLGLRIKKICPDIPLIADFRDPMDVVTVPKYQIRYRRRIQQALCSCADRIITVTNGHRKKICGDRWSEKTSVITNGYDAEDIADIDTLPVKDDHRLTFCFTGNLYGEKTNAGPLFRAVNKLVDDGVIGKGQAVFHYCGLSFPALLMQAQKADCEWILENHGQVDRNIALAMQNSVDIPVVMIWNNVGGEGTIAGKFYEYLTLDKQMLALVSGELEHSELRSLIEQYELGFTYEEASNDFERLCDWIAEQYKKKRSGVSLKCPPNEAALNHFEYSNIAGRVENIILGAIDDRRKNR